jgi:hypothetical protein
VSTHHELVERCLVVFGVFAACVGVSWLIYIAPFPVDIIVTAATFFLVGRISGRGHP